MNQEALIDHLWTSVIDPPSDRPTSIATVCDPDVEGFARALERVLASAADARDVHIVLRDVRSSVIFHAFVALEQDGAPSPRDVTFEDLWRLAPDIVLGNEVTAARQTHEHLVWIGRTSPIHESFSRIRAAGAPPKSLQTLMRASARFALARLVEGLRTLTDPLESPHESLGHREWPSVTPQKRTSAGPLLRLAEGSPLGFTPDAARVVSGRGRVFLVETGAQLVKCDFFANTSCVSVSPDARRVAATSTSGKVAICDLATGTRLHALDLGGEGSGARFDVDGVLRGATWQGTARAFDPVTGREVAIGVAPAQPQPPASMASHVAFLAGMVGWSPDGSLFALTPVVPTGFEVRRADGSLATERAFALAFRAEFSPDGRRIALGGYDRSEIWDVETLLSRPRWD